MDPIAFVVRSVCREFGVDSPIALHRIQSRVLSELAARCGGERFEFYVAKMPPATRAKRHRAILAEHAAGEHPAELARRHGLTVRRINQILQRQRAGTAPEPATSGSSPPWTIG